MTHRSTRRQFLGEAGAAAAAAMALGGCAAMGRRDANAPAVEDDADLVLLNGTVTTMDSARPHASAVAVRGGRFAAVGSNADILKFKGPDTREIDLGGRCVIPGLYDSHLHVIRGGLNYNLEL